MGGSRFSRPETRAFQTGKWNGRARHRVGMDLHVDLINRLYKLGTDHIDRRPLRDNSAFFHHNEVIRVSSSLRDIVKYRDAGTTLASELLDQ